MMDMEKTEENIITSVEEEDDSVIKRILNVDEYIQEVGDKGVYQIRTQIIFFIFTIPITAQIFITYFVAHNPPWRCHNNSTICKYNHTITPQDITRFKERCEMPRSEWGFTKAASYSVITQFELVCEKQFQGMLANSMVFFGWSIGGVLLTYLADKIGRKKTIFLSTAIVILSAIISVVANDFYVFIITRFTIGVTLGGGSVTIYVLAAEIVGPAYRAFSCTMVWIYFASSMVILTGVAYFSQNWKITELVISVPFILLIITWRHFPESTRWMRIHGKIKDAEELLQTMAKVNKKPVPNAYLKVEKDISGTATLLNLFFPLPILLQSIVQMVSWTVAGLTYFAFSFASQDLSGNFYGDFILTSVVEVPANIAVIYFSNTIGRKKAVLSHSCIATTACILLAFIPLDDPHNGSVKYYRLIAGMFGKYAATCYFNTLFIWSAELHPTALRTQGVGFFVVMSRIGGSIAPILMASLKYINQSLPFYIMTGLNFLITVLCLYLPETKGRPITDTVEENLKYLGYEKKKTVK